MNDDALTRNGQGELAVRTVSTSGDNYVDKNDVYTRDNDGKLCVRTVGNGGGGGDVTSVNGKTGAVILTGADLTTLIEIDTATLTQELANDTIYDCGEMTSITLTFPATMDAKFISQLNFTSGSTPTAFTSPVGMVWLGDDVSTTFVPVANKRYAIMVFFDGVSTRGIVQAA